MPSETDESVSKATRQATPRPRLGPGKKFLFLLVLLCALLLAVEGAVRVAHRLTHRQWSLEYYYLAGQNGRLPVAYLCYHPHRLQANRRDFSCAYRQPIHHAGEKGPFHEERVIVRTNSLGLRGPETSLAKPEGVYRVVCMGGSTTWGWGPNVRADQVWPLALGDALARSGRSDIEVLNAGVVGYTSLQNVIYLAEEAVDLQPDLVVLYQTYNDMQSANLQQGALRHGFRRDYAYRRRPLAPDPVVSLLENSMLFCKARFRLARAFPGANEMAPTSAPRIHPGGSTVFGRNLQSFAAVARAHGAKVLLVSQPYYPPALPAAMREAWPAYEQAMKTVAAETEGVAFYDLRADFDPIAERFSDCIHLTPAGNAEVARLLSRYFLKTRSP